jgi:hypothetical protein
MACYENSSMFLYVDNVHTSQGTHLRSPRPVTGTALLLFTFIFTFPWKRRDHRQAVAVRPYVPTTLTRLSPYLPIVPKCRQTLRRERNCCCIPFRATRCARTANGLGAAVQLLQVNAVIKRPCLFLVSGRGYNGDPYDIKEYTQYSYQYV